MLSVYKHDSCNTNVHSEKSKSDWKRGFHNTIKKKHLYSDQLELIEFDKKYINCLIIYNHAQQQCSNDFFKLK